MARPGARRRVGEGPAGGSGATRRALVQAAIDALVEEGYAGATAREVARRAGVNQGLVFYHFGTVTALLLAALDEVSERRRQRYQEAVDGTDGLGDLVGVAGDIFEEDLDAGYVSVLVEMIGGASSTPGLRSEVAARLVPWREFAARALRDAVGDSPVGPLVPADELAHAVIALYLGLEMLAHLDGDRAPATALFARAGRLAALVESMFTPPRQEART